MQSIVMKSVEWVGVEAGPAGMDGFADDPARSIRGVRNLAVLSLLFWVFLGVLLFG